jgi:hypothetical protein
MLLKTSPSPSHTVPKIKQFSSGMSLAWWLTPVISALSRLQQEVWRLKATEQVTSQSGLKKQAISQKLIHSFIQILFNELSTWYQNYKNKFMTSQKVKKNC